MKSLAGALGIFICLFSVICLSSCSRPSQSPTPYTALEFRVDSTRQGERIDIDSLTLRAPLNWMKADSGMIAQVRAAAAQDSSRFRSKVLAVYLDSTNGSFLVTSKHPASEARVFRDWGLAFVQNFTAAHPSWTVREDWILVNEIQTLQIFAADSIRVFFSFLIDRQPPLQLDYIVPSVAWEQQMRSVESSIGSLSKR